MHYVEEGQGDPILFVHGQIASSYLWRNIIPYLSPHGRCIALDLIGMGKSDKPDIAYDIFDHLRYVEGFIEALALSNVTLVLQGWGTVLGFHYAMEHEGNVKAIAIIEPPFLKQGSLSELPFAGRLTLRLFGAVFRGRITGWFMHGVLNDFIRVMLPMSVNRQLTDEERRRYAEPYPTLRSRKPLRMWPRQLPVEGKTTPVSELIEADNEKLRASPLPKLILYGTKNASLDDERAEWCHQNIKNVELVEIEGANYLMQEDDPQAIGEKLATWYAAL
jgi:haloalkane dehalogenase